MPGNHPKNASIDIGWSS